MEECVTTLVIGDPHFKARHELVCQSYIDGINQHCKTKATYFYCYLGRCIARAQNGKGSNAHKLVEQFFERLSQITNTYYVLMGNHDLINAKSILDRQSYIWFI